MRKSFYQMLQLIEGNVSNHYQNNINSLKNSSVDSILNSIKNKNQRNLISAQFSLYCLQDCYNLTENYNQTLSQEASDLKSLAKNCIDLIESYLKNLDSVTEEELRNSSELAYDIAYDLTYELNIVIPVFTSVALTASFAANNIANIIYDNNIDSNNIDNYFFYSSHIIHHASNAFYEANEQNENIRQQKESEYKSYLINLIHNYHANIEFDTKTDKELFINQITNNNTKSPQFWNTDEWLYFFTLAQDEYDIPLITQHNDSWIINPNFGNYNIETKDPQELINYIITNPDLKNFRLQLYDKIIDTI